MKRRKISPLWYLQALKRLVSGNARPNEPRLLYRDRKTIVVWQPAESKRLVVVFPGLQKGPVKPNRLDFWQAASDKGANQVLFVFDRYTSWYSRPGQRERITDIIRKFVAKQGIETVWALGNSMGGYGAILFCDAVPFSKVIAFSPQIQMTKQVLSRPNWRPWTPNITETIERDLVPIIGSTDCRISFVFGDQGFEDKFHFGCLRQVLPDAPNVRVAVAPGQDHEVAIWLGRQKLLPRLVSAFWTGDRQALEDFNSTLEPPLDLTLA